MVNSSSLSMISRRVIKWFLINLLNFPFCLYSVLDHIDILVTNWKLKERFRVTSMEFHCRRWSLWRTQLTRCVVEGISLCHNYFTQPVFLSLSLFFVIGLVLIVIKKRFSVVILIPAWHIVRVQFFVYVTFLASLRNFLLFSNILCNHSMEHVESEI